MKMEHPLNIKHCNEEETSETSDKIVDSADDMYSGKFGHCSTDILEVLSNQSVKETVLTTPDPVAKTISDGEDGNSGSIAVEVVTKYQVEDETSAISDAVTKFIKSSCSGDRNQSSSCKQKVNLKMESSDTMVAAWNIEWDENIHKEEEKQLIESLAPDEKEADLGTDISDPSDPISDKFTEDDSKYIKDDLQYLCTLCRYVCSNKSYIIRHIRAAHEDWKPYDCKMCSYSSGERTNMLRHIKIVHEKSNSIQCFYCDYKTKHKNIMSCHIKSAHKFMKLFQCSHCEYNCSRKTALTRHIQRIHFKLKQVHCPYCEYRCNVRDTLYTHIRKVHKKVKTSQCSNCSPKSSSLTDSVQSQNEDQYFCSRCNGNNTRKDYVSDALNDGEELHIYSCPYCLFTTEDKSQLNVHKQEIHKIFNTLGERRKKQLKCFECGKAFTRSTSLTAHIRSVHEGLKPFQCPHCDHRCSVRVSLTRHVNSVHMKVKPYQCSQCDYKSSEKRNLRKHVMAIHRIQPFICPFCDLQFSSQAVLDSHIRMIHDSVNDIEDSEGVEVQPADNCVIEVKEELY